MQLAGRVRFEQGLLDVLEESEGEALLHLFVSHAEHGHVVLIDVVEVVFLEFKGFHRVFLNSGHQLLRHFSTVALAVGVFCEDDALIFGDESVVNWHFLFNY